jgi:hypothetical protein
MRDGFTINQKISSAIKKYQQRREHARKLRLVNSTHTWYATCRQISETCGKALFEANAIPEDVGQVLDQVDRTLFKLRDDASDTYKAVKHHDRELAQRIEHITQMVYRLRNQTTRFLLRAQGPGILALGRVDGEGWKQWYYLRALEEEGFGAREIKKKLDNEIKLLWNELEVLLNQVYHYPEFAQ